MSKDDLISVHGNDRNLFFILINRFPPFVVASPVVPVRPPAATSIPSMLALFQNEWDATMLECYSLKTQLDSTRQELSHALFQYDAACRIIAKLLKEKEEQSGVEKQQENQ